MNLKQAVKLYDFIKPHLPKDAEKLQIGEYLRTIVSSIRINGNEGDFSKFFTLCTGKKLNKDMQSEDVIKALVVAIVEINLEELRKFLEGIGYG